MRNKQKNIEKKKQKKMRKLLHRFKCVKYSVYLILFEIGLAGLS